jgi:Zn-dependent peptidase ImmA (M78 family)
MSLIGKRKGRPTTRAQFESILKKFLVFLKRELKFYYDIPIILVDDVDFSKDNKTFGMMYPDKIVISIVNRHPIDILRTVAHEYIHHKQLVDGKKLNGNAGSTTENEANAKAGEILRKYGSLHPELFDLIPIR